MPRARKRDSSSSNNNENTPPPTTQAVASALPPSVTPQSPTATSNDLTKRKSKNDFETLTMSVNERIMKTVFDLYQDETEGLVKIAEGVGIKDLFVPRKKITVMIIGNHSSGKSSFINWYVDEHIQKTGVAIETQGFTIITNGKKKQTLKGLATATLYPFLQEVSKFKGVVENLATEICTSNEKKFPLVNFIDSPGLVDGHLQYPFDVEKVILWFAEQCDLILIFFDPIGQALCSRTMSIVEKINDTFPDKLRFYLSKADDVTNEHDRQKVLIQITQNLSIKLKNKNFDLPTIYLPKEKDTRVPNAINDVCQEIEKTINLNVQNSLNNLESDCNTILSKIDQTLKANEQKVKANRKAFHRGLAFFVGSLFLPLMVLFHFLNRLGVPLPDFTAEVPVLGGPLNAMRAFSDQIPSEYNLHLIGLAVGGFLFFLLASKLSWKYKPTLTKAQLQQYKSQKLYLSNQVLLTKQELYHKYFDQFVHMER